MSERNGQSELRLGHGHGQQKREESAGENHNRPLHRQQPRPVRIGKEHKQIVVAVTDEAKRQQRGAKAVKQSTRDLRSQTHEG